MSMRLGVLALTLAMVVAGCGQKAAEFVAEKAIEAGSGGQADVDISGDSANITMKTADGTEVEIGTASNVPDDFPEDVPLYPGLTVQSTAKESSKQMFTVTGSSEDAFTKVSEHLKSKLVEEGWTEDSAVTTPQMHMLNYKKDGRVANVQVIDANGATQVTVTTMVETP